MYGGLTEVCRTVGLMHFHRWFEAFSLLVYNVRHAFPPLGLLYTSIYYAYLRCSYRELCFALYTTELLYSRVLVLQHSWRVHDLSKDLLLDFSNKLTISRSYLIVYIGGL